MQITIVEDDAMVSNVLAAALQQSGFEVEVCSEQSAVEHISNSTPPDIVVIDLGVVFELGARACKEVLERNPACKLLPMTGSGEHSGALKLPDGSVVPVLHKPFSLRVFLGEIEALAERCRERDLCSQN